MKYFTIILLISISLNLFSQSNTPCGAPNLAPSGGCVNTLGSTTALTYQNDAANGGTPTCAAPGAPDGWYSFTTTTAGNYIITTSSGGGSPLTDTGLGLYNGPCGAPTEIACNDDATGLFSSITGALAAATTYYVRVWSFSSGSGTYNICIVAPPSAATNTTCALPNPICSGSPIVFTANTGGTAASVVNPGNNYGCLSTSPNPSWYYFKIATPGNIAIDITAGSDIDFALWGPYASLPTAIGACNTYPAPLDCSYSTAPIEQANALGVLTGQIYVLLVTNYANTVQNITVNTAAGNTGTTDCSIVPLSVMFGDITALETENGALISWFTYSEQNTSRFDIMHSIDGRVWNKIGSQSGALNSNEIKHYSFLDQRLSDGNNFYKLLEYDIDNTLFESETVSLYKETQGIKLYPNPTNGLINVSSHQTITNVQVNDLNGTVVYTLETNDKGVVLKLDHLKKGTYLVNVQTSYNHFVERIVIE
jgi:hypothetical protein